MFAAPVVAYDGYRTVGHPFVWLGRFLAALSTTFLAVFGTVFAVRPFVTC